MKFSKHTASNTFFRLTTLRKPASSFSRWAKVILDYEPFYQFSHCRHLKESRSSYNSIRKALRLIIEETDPQLEPEDISHVYSGYAPLSVRIIEHLCRPGGLRAIEEVLKQLPGPHFDLKQEMPKGFKAPGQSDTVSRKTPLCIVSSNVFHYPQVPEGWMVVNPKLSFSFSAVARMLKSPPFGFWARSLEKSSQLPQRTC